MRAALPILLSIAIFYPGAGRARRGSGSGRSEPPTLSWQARFFFDHLSGAQDITAIRKGDTLFVFNASAPQAYDPATHGELGVLHVFQGTDADLLFKGLRDSSNQENVRTTLDNPSDEEVAKALNAYKGKQSLLPKDAARILSRYREVLGRNERVNARASFLAQLDDLEAGLLAIRRGEQILVFEIRQQGIPPQAVPTVARIYNRVGDADEIYETLRKRPRPPPGPMMELIDVPRKQWSSDWDDAAALAQIAAFRNNTGNNLGLWLPAPIEAVVKAYHDAFGPVDAEARIKIMKTPLGKPGSH